ncbi:hypothetical protein [Nocardioides pantholopis]|uniref:hypothetical protein n=1 Tax=Nocardioides pantholopis TaxID=2483798 RepID=UPI000F08F276|nr:hypothetical protein [Nocardioides pantholopis]
MSTDPFRRLPAGRHPVNVAHLVLGVALLGLVGIWGLVQGDVVSLGSVRWLMPLPWVLAGLAGLLATTLGGRREARKDDRPRAE